MINIPKYKLREVYSYSHDKYMEYFMNSFFKKYLQERFKLNIEIQIELSEETEGHTVEFKIWSGSGLIIFKLTVTEAGELKEEVILPDNGIRMYASAEEIEAAVINNFPKTKKELCERLFNDGIVYIHSFLEAQYLDYVKEFFEGHSSYSAEEFRRDASSDTFCSLYSVDDEYGDGEVSFTLLDPEDGEYLIIFTLNEDLSVKEESIEYFFPNSY